MIDRLDETIVAISSAAGVAPIGIVRLTGPNAIAIMDKMVRLDDGERLGNRAGWEQVRGELLLDENTSIPVNVLIFRAPRSYTRQDLIELHTIGSPVVLEMVRKQTISLGALAALPGEFTARAFLNGSMDLAEAEAVAGVIRSQTDSQLRASRRQLDGMLSILVTEARDALAELLALVEADIDFAEEPIEFITPSELQTRLSDVRARLISLDRGAVSAERLDSLPRVLLLGPPNAGKSSLMNRLSGTNRAICAAVAGTTRDVLSAPITLGRGEAILLDSAGVEPQRHEGTKAAMLHDDGDAEVIRKAMEMSLTAAGVVDLVCVVVDATAEIDTAFIEKVQSLKLPKTIVAVNKCDLIDELQRNSSIEQWQQLGFSEVVAVSALCGSRIEGLQNAMAQALASGLTTASAEAVVLNERQRTAIRSASEAIERGVQLAGDAVETVDCADVLAFELREALDLLGEITGEVTSEDLLSQVFARFCIGK